MVETLPLPQLYINHYIQNVNMNATDALTMICPDNNHRAQDR